MINLEKYQKILDSGLLLDHYFLLVSINKGVELIKNKRIQGFYNLLTNKGYIEDGALTQAAIHLIDGDPAAITSLSPINKETVDIIATKKPSFNDWVMNLHEKCKNKLIDLTGSPQVRASIDNGKSYPFLCNAMDLAKVVTTVVQKYKLKDMDMIEKCLFRHIDDCFRKRNWFPLIRYYIQKDGQSSLVTDVLNPKEAPPDTKNTQKFL